MSVNFCKNGVILSNDIHESKGTNILINSEKYTVNNPYVVTGNANDIFATTDMYQQVSPGETYYLTCKTDCEWTPTHTSVGNTGKVSIWLYLSKEYNPSYMGYDSPIPFCADTNMIANGIWKYTIPAGQNMVRIRLNTYSEDGSTVSCKFWDINLIPEKYYTGLDTAMRLGEDYISAENLYEF